jgi:hypothetical protein
MSLGCRVSFDCPNTLPSHPSPPLTALIRFLALVAAAGGSTRRPAAEVQGRRATEDANSLTGGAGTLRASRGLAGSGLRLPSQAAREAASLAGGAGPRRALLQPAGDGRRWLVARLAGVGRLRAAVHLASCGRRLTMDCGVRRG